MPNITADVIGFLEKNPEPPAIVVRKFIEKSGYDENDVLFEINRLASKYVRFLTKGKSARQGIGEADVDPEQLALGIQIEKEHTDDLLTAKRIALDHLAEGVDYYTHLKRAEEKMEKRVPRAIAKSAFYSSLYKLAESKRRSLPDPVEFPKKRYANGPGAGSVLTKATQIKQTVGAPNAMNAMQMVSGIKTTPSGVKNLWSLTRTK